MIKKWMLAFSLAVLALGVFASGCKKADKVYQGHGQIMDFQADGKVIVLKHDKIEGLMDGMTMGFELKDPEGAKAFKKGDMVNFGLQVSDDNAIVISLAKAAN
jgi:Cu/Ag efflux protein CusF